MKIATIMSVCWTTSIAHACEKQVVKPVSKLSEGGGRVRRCYASSSLKLAHRLQLYLILKKRNF